MDLLDDRFKLEQSKDMDLVQVQVYATAHKKCRRAIYVKFSRVTSDAVSEYCEQHKKIMTQLQDSTSRDFFLLYDLRGILDTNYTAVAQQFIELHSPLRKMYDTRLLLTLIVIDNETMCTLLNYIFTELYVPTRPLRIMSSQDNVAEFVQTFWPKKLS